MNDYRLEIPANVWDHQDAEGLAILTRLLTNIQITGWTITREETPKPAPAVVIKKVKVYQNYYVCPEKGCFYTAASRRGLNNHRRTHK
jgi:hypothetical protein